MNRDDRKRHDTHAERNRSLNVTSPPQRRHGSSGRSRRGSFSSCWPMPLPLPGSRDRWPRHPYQWARRCEPSCITSTAPPYVRSSSSRRSTSRFPRIIRSWSRCARRPPIRGSTGTTCEARDVMRVLGQGSSPAPRGLAPTWPAKADVGRNVTTFSWATRCLVWWWSLCPDVRASAAKIVRKPAALSFEQAAAVPAAALTACRDCATRGASARGRRLRSTALRRRGQCPRSRSPSRMARRSPACAVRGTFDLVRSLGADHVVDYTLEDVTRGAALRPILDNGGTRPLSEFRRADEPPGYLLL